MPRLMELEPRFVTAVQKPVSEGGMAIRHVDTLAEAQGILFLCPKCFVENNGPVGTHCVLVWFSDRNVPGVCRPAPRWAVSGTGFSDLTTTPSIHVQTGCCWHGFVTNGVAS